jgi:methylated-DNA-[protein]-cysteine S-methyltransferase
MSDLDRTGFAIYYAECQTDILGQLFIAATDQGGYCIQFDEDAASFIANLVQQFPSDFLPSILHTPEKITNFCTALQNYFDEKTPIPLDLPIDLHDMTDFQKEILRIVRQIPFGVTTTYGEIADEIGNPNASRAIGQVLRRNPLPIIIPSHRVLNSDGTLGGYGGVMGSERKIALLKHEGIIFA